MLSRWFVTERSLRADKDQNRILHVQYAFLELPKLPVEKPASGAALWAWLFVHAPELTEIPTDLPPGPHRAALDLANEAKLTPQELEAYRKATDEIQQARDYGEQKEAEGFAKGETAGFAKALLAVLGARGLAVSPEARAHIEACADRATLERWMVHATTAASVEDVLAAGSGDGVRG